MQGNSSPVRSTQPGAHPRLAELVARHAANPFRKPPAAYSAAALAHLMAAWNGKQALILDAGCGTGESTHALARRHPRALVVGIDQSVARLALGARKAQRASAAATPPNALVLRADVVDFWLLLAARGIRLERHYLLYPNPWPKAAQVMRRWPAHPAFPLLLQLGGVLECRSNWRTYVEEFCLASRQLGYGSPACEQFVADDPLTPFERKYRDSGHALYRAWVDLDQVEALSRAAP
jgi:tRNA (guanine-N7-)-methyltransferase